MITKGSAEIPESFKEQTEIQKMDINPVIESFGRINFLSKGGMVKELHVLGLSNKAIGRVLHIHKDAVANILNIYDQGK